MFFWKLPDQHFKGLLELSEYQEEWHYLDPSFWEIGLFLLDTLEVQFLAKGLKVHRNHEGASIASLTDSFT